MADALGNLDDAFNSELDRIVRSDWPLHERLESRSEEEVAAMGRAAARWVRAQLSQEDRFGPMFDTSEVCERLGITRQAVAKKVAAGGLVGIPSGRTRLFPQWQFVFDGPRPRVRPQLAGLIAVWRKIYPEVTPLQIASWAMTKQPELDASPAEVMLHGKYGDFSSIVLAAQRAAAALAQ